MGWNANRVRAVASYLVRIVQVMGLTSLRSVELSEIDKAGLRWADNRGPERIGRRPDTSPRIFALTARKWLRYHGALSLPTAPPGRFDAQLAEFKKALECRGLAAITIRSYINRIRIFFAMGIRTP